VACPRCKYETETTAHILQCPNLAAQVIGERNTKEYRALLKDLETEPNMMEDLSEGFHMWSSNQPLLGCSQMLDNYNLSYHGTTSAMDSWQSAGKCNNNTTTKIIASRVLKSARQQWDHQNEELHWQQPNQVKDLEVNANIQEQYNIGRNGILNTSKALFQKMIEQIINLPHNDKQQWLAPVKAARNCY